MNIGAYIEHLTASGRSHKTIRMYVGALQRLEEACGPLDGLTAVGLAGYVAGLPNAYSTRRHLRTAYSQWCEMTGTSGPVGAIRVPRKPKYRCKALREVDTAALVKVALGWYPQGTAVLCGLYLALRASEIAGMRVDRFEEEMGWYRVTGKGDVTATLPVHPMLAGEMRRWAPGAGWVFPGWAGREHVTPQTIWNWTRLVGVEAGVVEDLWPHRLRHTALATANDNTGNLRAVADFARHRDLASTMIYTRTTDENLRRISDSLDYLESGRGGGEV